MACIFVVQDNRVQRRTVQIAAITEGFVEISSGVKAEEQVISRGGFNVKDGDPVNVTRINGEK